MFTHSFKAVHDGFQPITTKQKLVYKLLLITFSFFLAACGAGGDKESYDASSSNTSSTNPSGAATYNAMPASYTGTVSGLGSIVVNGVRFETTDAVVYDGDDFSRNYNATSSANYNSPLAIGVTVALHGDVDDAQQLGRAERIRVIGGVRGAVQAIDTAALTLTLPLQVVKLSAATVYAGVSGGVSITHLSQLAAITATQPQVTVYGVTQADNSFLATRVVVHQSSSTLFAVAVRGTITAINPMANGTNYTVSTGPTSTLLVSCQASCAIQPSAAVPKLGDPVRALATNMSQWNGTTLLASKLQLLNSNYIADFQGAPTAANHVKIKGTATLNNGVWTVAGVTVINADSALAAGTAQSAQTLFEIKGTWSGLPPNQVLNAQKVEIEGSQSHTSSNGENHVYTHELYGSVGNLTGASFTVQGVQVNAANAFFSHGSLATFQNGVFVEVKGTYSGTNGVFMASKVEIKSAVSCSPCNGAVFEVYGTVSGWTGAGNLFNLTRLGATMQAQTIATTVFKNRLPVNGDFVEVKGFMNANNVFQIVKLEIENNSHDDND